MGILSYPLSLAVLFSITLYIFINRFRHRFHHLPPCPFPSLPLIGHLYLLKKPFHKSLQKLSTKYGPVIHLQLGCVPVVLVSSPLAAEECFTKNDVVFANRPAFLNGKYFGYNYTSMPWSSYGDHWRNLRKISSLEVLSTNRLQMLSGIRVDEVRTLTKKIFQLTKKSTDHIDMRSACFEVTFNILTRIIAGKRYYGEDVEKSKEAKVFHEILAEISELNPKASVLDFLPFMRWFGLKDVERRMKDAQERRDKFMQNLIDEHRVINLDDDDDDGGKMKTMIGTLLALHEKDPGYYTDEFIRNLMLVLLQAGSDTTATTMEWAFAHLLDNPQVLNKAQLEIDNHVGQERLLDESDLPNLPYIRCIIYETLRIHPASPLLMPHKSCKDCTVGGFRVPQGTILFVNAWDIQQNPKYWDNPNKFMPERFEQSGGYKEDFKFIPFGIGRRGCPGNNLAIQVLGLALGSLIQSFNWEKTEEKFDMTEAIGVPPYKAQPLVAKLHPRHTMISLLSAM